MQGVKRGIMEIADLILVNKADGALKPQATRTCADYAGALRLMRKRPQDPEDFPKALLVSAIETTGLESAWQDMQDLITWRRDSGIWDQTRRNQSLYWFQDEVRSQLLARLTADPAIAAQLTALESKVSAGTLTPSAAAARVLANLA